MSGETQSVKSGQLASGFNLTARDLDMAIGNACFSGMENFLITRGRFASWAVSMLDHRSGQPLPPPLPFKLDLKALSSILGTSLDSLRAVFKRVVAIGVFVEAEDHPGFHLFGKDFRDWIDPKTGQKLLNSSLVSEAAEVREELRKNVAGWAILDYSGREKSRSNAKATEKNNGPTEKNNGPTEKNNGPTEKNNGLHIEESHTLSQMHTKEQTAEQTAAAAELPSEKKSDPEFDPAFPPPRSKPTPKPVNPLVVNRPSAAVPIVNDPADVETVAKWAESIHPGFGDEIRENAGQFHIWDIEAAVAKTKPGKGWRYTFGILAGWWSESGGKPMHGPGTNHPARASPNSRPSPPPELIVHDPESIARVLKRYRSPRNP
jgi:hypothetical protein